MKSRKRIVFFINFIILIVIFVLITIKIKEKIDPDVCKVNTSITSTLEILLPITCSNGGLFDNRLYGYANLKGDIVLLDESWIHTSPFNDHYFAIVTNIDNESAIINKKGRIILDYYYNDIIYLGEKMYFLAKTSDTGDTQNFLGTYKNGTINVKEIDYKFVYNFNQGFAAVITNSDRLGYINKEGSFMIPPIYDKNPIIPHQFINDQAVVILGGKYGVINSSKDVIVPFIYDFIQPINDRDAYFKFQRNKKWGLMNKDFQEIIPPIYQHIGKNSEGIVSVSFDDDNYAFLDIERNQIITDFRYKKALNNTFIDHYNYYQYGFAIVTTNDESFNLINKYGTNILSQNYSGIKMINRNYIVVKVNETQYYLISLINKEIVKKFEALDILVYQDYPLLAICTEKNEDGATIYQLYNLEGEELIKGLNVYEYMVEVTIEGKDFLYLNGELDGHLFSSYLDRENNLFFVP